jgi:integrase
MNAQPMPSAGPLSVGDVITLYKDSRTRDASPDGLKQRDKLLAEFSEALGRRLVTDVKPVEMLWWLRSHPGWKSSWTIRRVVVTIKTPFNWAAKYGLIDRNPFLPVTHEQGDPGRAMTNEEFQTLMRNSGPEFRRVVVFLRFTGCRPVELSQLEWQFFKPKTGCFVLVKHKSMKTRRDRKPRVIVLSAAMLKLLAWIRRHEPDARYVFVNSFRKRWTRSGLCHRIWRLRLRGLIADDCTLYACRHAFGTNSILAGVDLKTTATLMGHANTQVTEQHYLHIDGEIDHLRAALERVGRKEKPSVPAPIAPRPPVTETKVVHCPSRLGPQDPTRVPIRMAPGA